MEWGWDGDKMGWDGMGWDVKGWGGDGDGMQMQMQMPHGQAPMHFNTNYVFLLGIMGFCCPLWVSIADYGLP